MYKGEKEVKLSFLGDIMCKYQMLISFAYRTSGRQSAFDFESLFEEVKPLLAESDYVFANLETPISENNTDLCCERFRFNAPYEFAEAVKQAGIRFVSTANNHCLDRGIDGLNATVRSLERLGIGHTGTYCEKTEAPCIVTVSGIRLGILACTYGTNATYNGCYLSDGDAWCVDLYQRQELPAPDGGNRYSFARRHALYNKLRSVREEHPDLVILLLHTGGQYHREATPETEKLCNTFLQKGVNIVVGSHEHVVHGGNFRQISQNKLAAYSLGNFCGIAGVYDVPFDKLSEYSVAWHVYVDKETKQITKTSFSVLKTVQPDSRSFKNKVIPVYDLQNRLSGEALIKLKNDVNRIVSSFSGYNDDQIKSEYLIKCSKGATYET